MVRAGPGISCLWPVHHKAARAASDLRADLDLAEKMGHFKCLRDIKAVFSHGTIARSFETCSSLDFDVLDLK